MKRKNLICLLLVLSMSATFFMSCDDSSNKNPADTDAKTSGSTATEEITSEETTSTPENTNGIEDTDASKETDSDEKRLVDIVLHKTLTDDEFEAAVQKQIEENRIKAEEIKGNLDFYAEMLKEAEDLASTYGVDIVTHWKIKHYYNSIYTLKDELEECSTEYHIVAFQVAKKEYYSALTNFLKKYDFLSINEVKNPLIMTISGVSLTEEQIDELEKDESVKYITGSATLSPPSIDI